jgi:hypothetical protein
MRASPASAIRALPVCLVLCAPALAAQPVTKGSPAGTPARPAAAGQPAAQSAAQSAAARPLPAGWQMQLDRATMPPDQAQFYTMGPGYHATMGRASAVFFNPAVTASGAYTVDATFRQTKAPTHPEAYGLVIGGSKLGTDAPDYLYYVIRGDGKFLIRHRAGAELHTLQDWTANPAVTAADAQGAASNALRIAVAADTVRFFANGTEVAKFPKLPAVNTDGVVGVRVNHMLDVHVDGPRVTPAP